MSRVSHPWSSAPRMSSRKGSVIPQERSWRQVLQTSFTPKGSKANMFNVGSCWIHGFRWLLRYQVACQLQGRNAAEKKIYRDPPGFGSKEDLERLAKTQGSGPWWLVVIGWWFQADSLNILFIGPSRTSLFLKIGCSWVWMMQGHPIRLIQWSSFTDLNISWSVPKGS